MKKEDFEAEDHRKIFIGMAKDIRVILIKLADRLHNMRTMDHQPPHKQIENSQETMDVYVPLATQLGIHRWKTQLEDLSFKYLYDDLKKDTGKQVVQAYIKAPNGILAKPARVLIGYAKTSELALGASELVKIEASFKDFASFNDNDAFCI